LFYKILFNIVIFVSYYISMTSILNKCENLDELTKFSNNISVLQKNYEYLLWSILTAGAVIVTMNISRS
jgi:hypothetical protein